ncbi:MAG: cob(I)yrinic acid a,c-diamide adenosyltransferase [Bryobacteraceae bacterium]|jgi:cob(I)alamin adenosyltransferase
MRDQTLDASRITIDPIYTRRGDQGETSLAGGQRVAKDNARIEAYGVIDELNAFVGSARALAEESTDRNGRVWPLVPFLLRVQHELFNIGCILATRPEEVHPSQARVTLADVTRIEHEIDRINRDLPARRCFVLSGSGCLNGVLHQCRTICRRTERVTVSLARQEPVPPEAVQYLNRLADALFVWSRWVSHVCSESESLWDPDHSAPVPDR